MTGAEDPFERSQHASIDRFGFVELFLALQKGRQRGGVGRHLRMIRTKRVLSNRHGPARERFAAREPAASVFESSHVVEDGRRLEIVGTG